MADLSTLRPLSWTQYNMWMSCQTQYWFRYVMRLKSAPAGAVKIGSWGHKSQERYFSELLNVGERLPLDVYLGIWEQLYTGAVVKKSFDEEGPIDWGDLEPAKIRDQMLGLKGMTSSKVKTTTLQGLLPKVYAEHNPYFEPRKVEEKFDFEIAPGVRVIGFIDLYGLNGQGRLAVTDWKFTTGRKPSAAALENDDQTTLYHLAATQRGRKVEVVSLDYLFVKDDPDIATFPMKRNKRKDHPRIKQEFVEFSRQLALTDPEDPTTFAMAPRMLGSQVNWKCSERFCGYWSRCPRGGGKYKID